MKIPLDTVTSAAYKATGGYEMNPMFGSRRWVKLWVNEWLDGTTRFRLSDQQRAFWVDLIALAGRSRTPGIVAAGVEEGEWVGYPVTKFQSLLAGPLDIEGTLRLFEKTGKIAIEETQTEPVKLYKITLLNWNRFQSEYSRQKKYREKKKLQPDYAPDYAKGNTTEVEVEEKLCVVDVPFALEFGSINDRERKPKPLAARDRKNKNLDRSPLASSEKKNVSHSAPEAAVFTLPLNDNSFHSILKSDIEKWSALYPAVDVEGELRKIIGWLDANPRRRKTRSGVRRFVNAWLSNAQDKGGGNAERGTESPAERRTRRNRENLGLD